MFHGQILGKLRHVDQPRLRTIYPIEAAVNLEKAEYRLPPVRLVGMGSTPLGSDLVRTLTEHGVRKRAAARSSAPSVNTRKSASASRTIERQFPDKTILLEILIPSAATIIPKAIGRSKLGLSFF
jgi:hypothetical protein